MFKIFKYITYYLTFGSNFILLFTSYESILSIVTTNYFYYNLLVDKIILFF